MTNQIGQQPNCLEVKHPAPPPIDINTDKLIQLQSTHHNVIHTICLHSQHCCPLCSALCRRSALRVCVCPLPTLPLCRDNAWSTGFNFRGRYRQTPQTQRGRGTLLLHPSALDEAAVQMYVVIESFAEVAITPSKASQKVLFAIWQVYMCSDSYLKSSVFAPRLNSHWCLRQDWHKQ